MAVSSRSRTGAWADGVRCRFAPCACRCSHQGSNPRCAAGATSSVHHGANSNHCAALDSARCQMVGHPRRERAQRESDPFHSPGQFSAWSRGSLEFGTGLVAWGNRPSHRAVFRKTSAGGGSACATLLWSDHICAARYAGHCPHCPPIWMGVCRISDSSLRHLHPGL